MAMISVTTIGATKLARALAKEIEKYSDSPVCKVGIGTNYGIYVHEHTWKSHKPPTEAKFMERAYDKIRPTYKMKLKAKVKKYSRTHRKPLHAALYSMGLELDADMVPRIPVKTGRLRASHYVTPPKGIAPRGDAPTSPKGGTSGPRKRDKQGRFIKGG